MQPEDNFTFQDDTLCYKNFKDFECEECHAAGRVNLQWAPAVYYSHSMQVKEEGKKKLICERCLERKQSSRPIYREKVTRLLDELEEQIATQHQQTVAYGNTSSWIHEQILRLTSVHQEVLIRMKLAEELKQGLIRTRNDIVAGLDQGTFYTSDKWNDTCPVLLSEQSSNLMQGPLQLQCDLCHRYEFPSAMIMLQTRFICNGCVERLTEREDRLIIESIPANKETRK